MIRAKCVWQNHINQQTLPNRVGVFGNFCESNRVLVEKLACRVYGAVQTRICGYCHSSWRLQRQCPILAKLTREKTSLRRAIEQRR